MGRKKECFLIVDTETATICHKAIAYDIGYAICDRQGKIYLERSFVVSEIFNNQNNFMNSAYYSNKIPEYWKEISDGSRILENAENIRDCMWKDIKAYNVKKVGAYNMNFDQNSLNNTINFVFHSKLQKWFPENVKFFCIWNMACQVVLNTTTYVKFARSNNFVTEANNIQTSAEACYRFLTDSPDFVESHTALEDVRIEVEILAKCYKTHKKMVTSMNSQCWRIPQKKNKELELKNIF